MTVQGRKQRNVRFTRDVLMRRRARHSVHPLLLAAGMHDQQIAVCQSKGLSAEVDPVDGARQKSRVAPSESEAIGWL